MSLAPRIDRLDKNYVINGNFDIWQRGTSFTSVSAQYAADRFSYNADTTAADITRQSDVPSGLQYKADYSLRAARVSSSSPGVNDVAYIKYTIEGYDLVGIRNKDITISFWVKSTKTGTYCLTLKDSAYAGTYIKEYTIDAANTWERKVINVTLSDSIGTWLYNNGAGLRLHWMLQAGTNRRGASANTWFSLGGANTASWATANQVNAFDANSSSLQLAQVQVIEGTHTDPTFSTAGRNFADELALCQRYYEKSYDLEIAPGTTGSFVGSFFIFKSGTNSFLQSVSFKVRKRAAPTMTERSISTGASGTIDQNNVAVAGTPDEQGETGFLVRVSGAATDQASYRCHWTADSEL
jgi:hypothetical protein